jgi:MoaA/NifB/PqqE/SkfB family radical SAM enzyme
MSFTEYKKIIKYFDEVHFCGNVSDPTMHNDFHWFLKLSYLRNIKTYVDNAASHRSESWYLEAFNSNPDAHWTFGIDGIPEESHLYRKNQDGSKLFEMMFFAKQKGLNVLWNYIIFKYNEDTMQEAKQLADYYKIPINFIRSSRFNEDDELKPTNPQHYVERDYEQFKTKMSFR